jgi:DNA polymerase III subunit gamma/tau
MTHTVLARKWRPKKFTDLVGQQTSVTVLNNILTNGRLHHAYLLTGTRGVGKTTIARIIAKALNCLNPQQNEPCCACQNCTDIDRGRFVDVIEIDAASNTGVDNIRELIDNAQYAPVIGKYKVYIIDEVHMLSKSAFNAMLKTLEEPPTHVIFILATTDLQKVPITILSRCLQLKLRNLLTPEISAHLAHVLTTEKIDFEADALQIVADLAHGSMRDALSLLDQAIAYTDNNVTTDAIKQMLGITDDSFIFAILDALQSLNSKQLAELAEQIYNQGNDLENVLLKLNQQLCDLNLVQLGAITRSDNIAKYATLFSINDIQLYFEISNLGLEQISKTKNKYQVFIMTLFRMLAFNLGSNDAQTVIISQTKVVPKSETATNGQQSRTQTTSVESDSQQNSNTQTSHILGETKTITSNPTINMVEQQTSIENATTNKAVIIKDNIEAKPTSKKENLNVESVNKTENIADTSQTVNAKQARNNNYTASDSITNNVDNNNLKNHAIEFNGNWIELIENVELKLDHHLRPFLENAKLVDYTDSLFNITVDNKYQSAFNDQVIEQINGSFSNLLAKPITFNIEFADETTDTLKEKRQLHLEQKQLDAEQAIKEDPNLAALTSLFSATIAPNSIKPL